MFGIFDEKKRDESRIDHDLGKVKFERFDNNPLIIPSPTHTYMGLAAYSPAALLIDDEVHIVFRAQAQNKISTFGYARSRNGRTIDEISEEPIYAPREPFEMSTNPGWNSGCEDPRLTILDGRIYMTYTAYDGTLPPRVALTSIDIDDFLKWRWNWDKPKLISPPGVPDKDACIVKHKGDGYLGFHRLGDVVWLDFLRDLKFPEVKFLTGGILLQPRTDNWDNIKVGIAGPPIETKRGWLLFYHAISNPGFAYKIGAIVLEYDNPRKILARSDQPLLEPQEQYEREGQVPNDVFSCGQVVKDGTIYLYYSGADTVICGATIDQEMLLEKLFSQKT